jgi:hypothetical protein
MGRTEHTSYFGSTLTCCSTTTGTVSDQLHWEAGKLPQVIAELALRFANDVDTLNPRGERRHQHLGLEASQHLADT